MNNFSDLHDPIREYIINEILENYVSYECPWNIDRGSIGKYQFATLEVT